MPGVSALDSGIGFQFMLIIDLALSLQENGT